MGVSGMTKEPKQEEGGAQGTEQKDTSSSKLREFFANPTLVLSLLYIYATALGMLYSRFFYGKFGINVFDYSEISDFLLAALKNPFAILLAGFLALLAIVYGVVWVKLTKTDETHSEDERRRVGVLSSKTVILTGLFLLISILWGCVLTLEDAASRAASSIKAGETPSVDVRYRSFKGSAGQITVPSLRLIGATQKAAFFYDADDKRTIVIPQSQIVSIEVPQQH
jgi:cytochrome bd-type quinol oxidase subunit 2